VRPDASVIICAYTAERWDHLIAAVGSVQRQSLPPREIVVVVDDNPLLLDRARRELADVRVVHNHGPSGLSGARNAGVAAARGELVAFIDDDAVAAPDWLDWLTASCVDPSALGIGGAVVPLWPSRRPTWLPEEFDWVVGCSYRGLPDRPAPVRNPIGANMCLRREIFEAVGGFQPGIGRVGTRPVGCEETELCIRARQRWPERRFLYEPRARVLHHVAEQRTRWRYYRQRCFAEGISKAIVARQVGAQDGLACERSYVLRTLPRGLGSALSEALLYADSAAAARACAIVAGLTITAAGYAFGALSARRLPRPQSDAAPSPAAGAAIETRP